MDGKTVPPPRSRHFCRPLRFGHDKTELSMARGAALTSLIFPTYNPGPAVEMAWEAVREFLGSARERWEVLFVCDGCTDGTPERLARLCSFGGLPVRILSYPTNRGKGYAVRQGMLAAQGRWRIFADVDMAYGFDEIGRVASALRAGADVAIAAREHPDSEVVLPARLLGHQFRRRLQSRLFRALVQLLLPIRQRDTQAGLKGLSAAAVQRIVPRLRCDGFGFDCELLTACVRLGVRVEEVPVRVRYRDADSTAAGWARWGMVGDLFGIRRAWRRLPEPLPQAAEVTELCSAAIDVAQASSLCTAAVHRLEAGATAIEAMPARGRSTVAA